ncbi:MAG TPA: thioesterase family protein [Chloroflexia bacterium]|nr:thioesterase family protein [Chloroflexia bacterium]
MGTDKEWRFYIIVEVKFRDIDMFGHVNNAAYLTYIESARVAYYTALTGLTDPREFGMTLASAKVDFLKPIFYGQAVRVYTRIGRVGNKSWTLEHEIRDAETGEVMAVGSTVNVHYDYKSEQSLPLPAELVAKMEEFEARKLRD